LLPFLETICCRFRQQSFRFWQQFVAENGNKVASVDRPLATNSKLEA